METIQLALKPIYLEAIRIGAKPTEFRTLDEYYVRKLVDVSKYPGKSEREIADGLHDGTLELFPRNIGEILFHESGTGQELRVEVKYIKVYRGHHNFCIGLGKVLTDKKNEDAG